MSEIKQFTPEIRDENKGLDSNVFFDQKEVLEKLNLEKLPKMQELYQAYGYEQPETEMVEQETVNLKTNMDQIFQISHQAARFAFKEIAPLENIAETTPLGELEMGINVYRGSESGLRTIRFNLNKAGAKDRVASFFIQQDSENENNWDLGHRLIEPQYRNQNLGTKMLELVESGVQQMADLKNENQELSLEASQIGVILFALKNGYQPAEPEDLARLKEVLKGDKDKYFLTTGKGYQRDGRQVPGYIYERQKITEAVKEAGQEVSPQELEKFNLDNIFYGDPDAYFNNSVKIKLVKNFTPIGPPWSLAGDGKTIEKYSDFNRNAYLEMKYPDNPLFKPEFSKEIPKNFVSVYRLVPEEMLKQIGQEGIKDIKEAQNPYRQKYDRLIDSVAPAGFHRVGAIYAYPELSSQPVLEGGDFILLEIKIDPDKVLVADGECALSVGDKLFRKWDDSALKSAKEYWQKAKTLTEYNKQRGTYQFNAPEIIIPFDLDEKYIRVHDMTNQS